MQNNVQSEEFAGLVSLFLRQKKKLEQSEDGHWVVYANGALQGRFFSFGEAFNFAQEQFSEKTFLIRSVAADEPFFPMLSAN